MQRGFTLVQLLTVLAVIGVLAAIMISVFTRGRASARQAQCDAHLKDLTLALNEFRTENGHFPEHLVDLRTKGYIQDDSALHCPSDPDEQGSYGEYYAIRASRDNNDRPILVCPFHEADGGQGMQAFKDRQTQHGKAMKAQLQGASDTTVERPGQEPIAARGGMEVHGGDLIRTGSGGSATIVFADGSSSELRGGSSVTVMQSFRDGRSTAPLYTMVRQKFGDVLYKVIPGSRFDVVTPTATAGALGTEFRIQINEQGSGLLYVTESTVYVSTLDQNVKIPTGGTCHLTGDDSGSNDPGSGNPGSGNPGSGSGGGSNPGTGTGTGTGSGSGGSGSGGGGNPGTGGGGNSGDNSGSDDDDDKTKGNDDDYDDNNNGSGNSGNGNSGNGNGGNGNSGRH
jgi:prepilin-type N-terminal cleavage/methylation domain-containing protein